MTPKEHIFPPKGIKGCDKYFIIIWFKTNEYILWNKPYLSIKKQG
jgi:hypothetical protein